jgi:REP element-mobilizing transposase RayT
MEIKRRVGLPRMNFHVMNRGARGISIFSGEEDRSLFVGLMGKLALKYEVGIVSWGLMPNHYHLEPDSEGNPLVEMMRDLDGTYARAYNERHGTWGCLFQGPFKSMAIRDVEGLAYVSRHIHRNPLSTGHRPEDYRWSSCRSYLGLERIPAWLRPWPVLDHCREKGMSAIESYRKYLAAAPLPTRTGRASTDEFECFYLEFIRHLEERFLEKLIPLNGLLGRISPRTVVAWAAHNLQGIPARRVADYYGYKDEDSVRALVGRFQMRLDDNPRLREILESVSISATRKR